MGNCRLSQSKGLVSHIPLDHTSLAFPVFLKYLVETQASLPPETPTDPLPQLNSTESMPLFHDTTETPTDPLPPPDSTESMLLYNDTTSVSTTPAGTSVETKSEDRLGPGLGFGTIIAIIILMLLAGISIGLLLLVRQRGRHKEETVKQGKGWGLND